MGGRNRSTGRPVATLPPTDSAWLERQRPGGSMVPRTELKKSMPWKWWEHCSLDSRFVCVTLQLPTQPPQHSHTALRFVPSCLPTLDTILLCQGWGTRPCDERSKIEELLPQSVFVIFLL